MIEFTKEEIIRMQDMILKALTYEQWRKYLRWKEKKLKHK